MTTQTAEGFNRTPQSKSLAIALTLVDPIADAIRAAEARGREQAIGALEKHLETWPKKGPVYQVICECIRKIREIKS